MTESGPATTFPTAGDLSAYLAERARGQAATTASRSLLDILSPLVQRTEQIAESLRAGDGRYAGDTAHDELAALLERCETDAGQAGIRRSDVEDAVLATVAWIDEALSDALRPTAPAAGEDEDPFADPEAPEPGGQELYRLQTTRFEISDAGVRFFEKLSELSADQSAVREVYVAMLELGYRGQYFAEDDRRQLDGIKREHAEKLMTATLRPAAVEPDPVAPAREPAASSGRRGRMMVAAAIALVAVVGTAFAVAWYVDCDDHYNGHCTECTLSPENCFH